MAQGSRSILVRAWLLPALSVPVVALLAAGPSRADDVEAGGGTGASHAADVFQGRCAACHSYGKGKKVGPDLKGVTERRQRGWLVRFVRGSSAMIAAGDPTATALFAEFGRQRMPDWSDLSPRQVEDILDYLAAGGPGVGTLEERHAGTATREEQERGRLLFDGAARFVHGARACVSCHAAEGSTVARGGSLGPDLSTVYFKFRDKALTSFLREPCFLFGPAGGGSPYLTPEEIFAVKAFLRQAALGKGIGAGAGG
jgi:mono/diheme cytochrome c family protein